MRGRLAEWVGAIARIVAYVGVGILLMMVLTSAIRAMPFVSSSSLIVDTAVMSIAALAAGALLLHVDGRTPAALGIAVTRATPLQAGVGVTIGAAGLVAAVTVLLLTGALGYSADDGTATAWVRVVAVQAVVFTVAALAEEAVFRGYAFQVLARTGGVVVATVVSAALFALAHGGNPSVGVFALINIFLAGILLAIAYLRTLSLWFATAVHMGWNWAMATLFDLPVSGLEMFDTPLYEPTVGGPDWWSGARFGPEGGLVGTIGFAVALLLVLRWRVVQPDAAIVAARPLVLPDREELHAG